MSKKLIWLSSVVLAVALLASACASPGVTETPTQAPVQTQNLASPTQPPAPTATAQPEPPAAPAQPAGSDLEGVTWLLETYQDAAGASQPVLANTQVTAIFADAQISGKAGCNNYFASFELSGDQLKIGPAGSTMMFCAAPAGIMDQETAYLKALENVTGYQLEAGRLLMADSAGKTVLSYIQTPEAPPAEAAAPLFGTPWEVVSYGDGVTTVATPIKGTRLTAIFGEDGQVAGSTGCNDYTAAFQTDGDQIKIGPPAATRMACAEPPGLMNQETTYLAAIMQAARFQLAGSTLELYNALGQPVVVYKVEGSVGPASAAPAAPAPGAGLTVESLKNATYQNDFVASGTVTLVDGEYSEPAAPGSAISTTVTLVEPIAFGELADGQTAAAVVLVTNPGGSGTFYTLALMLDQNGLPVNVATTFLGDRIQLNSVSFKDGQIVVDMITQGPGDAMCCPTQPVLQTYAYQNNALVLVSSEEASGGALTGSVWKWVETQESNDSVIKPADPNQYTLEFLPGGKVFVKADCNTGSGVYQVNGPTLSITIQTLTLDACEPGSLSNKFIQYLSNVASYMFRDDNLYLALKIDTGIMEFKP